MADETPALELTSYDDCIRELVRVRAEIDQITDHMYYYESSEDTVSTETTHQIVNLHRRIDDDLGELYAICNQG